MAKTHRALVVLHAGFEEVEAVTPIDLLARANISVVQAALDENPLVRGRNGMTLQATHHFDDVAGEEFDVLIIPGGPGIHEIRRHPVLCKRLQHQHAENKWIACICAAPLMLHDAGLLEGRRYTCHPSAADELANAVNEPVVEDGVLLTSRGAGTAIPFALYIIGKLEGESAANEVAEAICWTQ